MLVMHAAKNEAEKVLDSFGSCEGALDVVNLAESQGAKVVFGALKDGISGAIIAEHGKKPVIYVEESDSPGRQRFTIMHELGHLIERRANGDDEYSFVEKRGAKYDLHEFYADEFAGNVLMPESSFRRIYRGKGDELAAAAHFSVTPSAVLKRAERLGLV